MKKNIFASILFLLGAFTTFTPTLVSSPVYAASGDSCECKGCKDEDGNTCKGTMSEGAILSYCDCGHGEGVISILNLVVEIMTIGVGILATIGISIAGIQYLTAGGSEEQTRKAKRRIFEIVIGLAAYVLIYVILSFLLPGFKPFQSV